MHNLHWRRFYSPSSIIPRIEMYNILLSQLYQILHQILEIMSSLSESNLHLLWACLGVCSILFPQCHASAHYFQVTVIVNFHRAFRLIYGNNLFFVTATTYYVFRNYFFVSACSKNIYEIFSCSGHMRDSILLILNLFTDGSSNI